MNVKISQRELEVLNFISMGFTAREIAGQLFLSFHTIESHKKNLMRKLDARNKAHLVRLGFEKCLLEQSYMMKISAWNN